MVFNVWTILIWLLALQGLILGIVILRKPTRNRYSNRLIGILLFIFFLACLGLILKEWKHEANAWIQVFPFYHLILVGPIIYLFLRSELEKGFQPAARHLGHFAVGLWSFRTVLLPFQNATSPQVPSTINTWLTYFFDYGDVFVWLVITSYLVLALSTYKSHKSSPRSVWLKQFLDLFVFFQFAIWLPIIALHISPFQFVFEDLGISYEAVYVPFAMIIYWIGIKWFTNSPTLTFKSVTKRFIEKRLSSDVPKSCVADLYEQVIHYEIYRHQDATVDDVAALFRVSEDTITYLLHQEIGQTFDDFLDSIRVQQILTQSQQENYANHTFEELALQNGFASLELGKKAIKEYTALGQPEIEELIHRV